MVADSQKKPAPESQQPAELVQVVDDLLNQLNSKFSTISSELIEKSKSAITTKKIVKTDFDIKWTRCPEGLITSRRTSRVAHKIRPMPTSNSPHTMYYF